MGCGTSTPAVAQPSPQQRPAAGGTGGAAEDGGLEPAAQPAPPQRWPGEAQIFLSYRTDDTGSEELGGDGTSIRIKLWLEAHDYSVFIGEASLEGGQEWSTRIQDAVIGCEVFVPVCSSDYGNTGWTFREYQLADSKRKTILPLWNSGPYPPRKLEIFMAGLQRVPSGNKPLVETDFEAAMQEVLRCLRREGCLPGGQQQQPARPLAAPLPAAAQDGPSMAVAASPPATTMAAAAALAAPSLAAAQVAATPSSPPAKPMHVLPPLLKPLPLPLQGQQEAQLPPQLLAATPVPSQGPAGILTAMRAECSDLGARAARMADERAAAGDGNLPEVERLLSGPSTNPNVQEQ
ncbi:hypothetical protein TSOC_014464, partial [Tetrabaena socialis]